WPFTPIVVGELNTNDSTANGNNGTAYNGASAVAGSIGDGASFNGSNEYVGLGSGATLMPSGATTASAWVKASSTQVTYPMIVSAGNVTGVTGYNLYLTSGEYPSFIVKEGSNSWGSCQVQGAKALNDSSWHLVTGVYSGTSIAIYVDGAVANTTSCANLSINYGNGPAGEIGWKLDAASNDDFNGVIDEVRVSNTARSADWIATEYNNQSAPSTFYSIAATQAISAQPQYAISGKVSTTASVVLTGVTVTLSGSSSETTTTNTGDYEFAGLVAGSYTVTPSMTGATFSPAASSTITLSSSQTS